MDRDGFVVWVEDDNLEKATSSISADHQHAVITLAYNTKRNTDCGSYVVVRDGVPASTVRDLHH